MRGDKCHYDHGPDPVVVDDSALEKIVRTSALSNATTMFSIYNSSLTNPPPPGVESKLTGVSGCAPEGN